MGNYARNRPIGLLVPEKEKKYYYQVTVWVDCGGETYSSNYDFTCYPDELDEQIELYVEEEYRLEDAEIRDWQINEIKELRNFDI